MTISRKWEERRDETAVGFRRRQGFLAAEHTCGSAMFRGSTLRTGGVMSPAYTPNAGVGQHFLKIPAACEKAR
jgi:hypothetical protein